MALQTAFFQWGFAPSDNYCLIEWPEKITNLWPERYVQISLSISDKDERKITADINVNKC